MSESSHHMFQTMRRSKWVSRTRSVASVVFAANSVCIFPLLHGFLLQDVTLAASCWAGSPQFQDYGALWRRNWARCSSLLHSHVKENPRDFMHGGKNQEGLERSSAGPAARRLVWPGMRGNPARNLIAASNRRMGAVRSPLYTCRWPATRQYQAVPGLTRPPYLSSLPQRFHSWRVCLRQVSFIGRQPVVHQSLGRQVPDCLYAGPTWVALRLGGRQSLIACLFALLPQKLLAAAW
jgi:hypothetical protein